MGRLALAIRLAMLVAAGCGRLGFGEGTPRFDARDVDAPEVAATDAPTICVTWTARHFVPCDLPSPTGGLDLSMPGTYVYDTTAATLTDPIGNSSSPATLLVAPGRVISVDALTIRAGVTLRVNGAQPLIVASWTDIQIQGTVDASSTALALGAGGDADGCATHAAQPGGNDSTGAGGGGGAGFGGRGGRGGPGDGAGGGPGGTAAAAPLLAGGCAGAIGGHAGQPQQAGAGGGGGGAIQLTARDAITIDGIVHAGGGGGTGGDNDSGGGGGGSGGMIGLEAPNVKVTGTATLAANGGSGGGGADNASAGGNGADGAASAVRAMGGRGGDSGDGGNGGLGSGGATITGENGGSSSLHAGGGAGGGAGYIVISSTSATIGGAIVSPAPVTP